jgi:hypothetical protein
VTGETLSIFRPKLEGKEYSRDTCVVMAMLARTSWLLRRMLICMFVCMLVCVCGLFTSSSSIGEDFNILPSTVNTIPSRQ